MNQPLSLPLNSSHDARMTMPRRADSDPGRKIKEAEDYATLSANVQSYVGLISWRPAPQTLNYIHQIALGFSPADTPMHAGWVPDNRPAEQQRDPHDYMHPFYRPKF